MCARKKSEEYFQIFSNRLLKQPQSLDMLFSFVNETTAVCVNCKPRFRVN